MHKQRGVSLVELMVATAIGLILMTGVIQLFLSSRATFATQQAVSRVQETGRLAMEFVTRDIRMAGFMGCISRNMSLTNTLNQSNTLPFRFDVAIEGADIQNDGGGNAPAGYPSALAGTDVVVVRSAGGASAVITQNNNGAQLFVEYTGEDPSACGGNGSISGICQGDILVVSDCSKARVFQVTGLTATSGNTQVNLQHAASGDPGNHSDYASWGGSSPSPEEIFGPGSQIIQINTTAYYIDDGNDNRPALWRRIGTQPAQQLMAGVENMQLEYGLDTTGDGIPDDYRSANDMGNWNRVAGVRVQLLVASADDNVLSEPQSYTFNGNTVVDPGDRRLRQVFVSTVGIRSRLP